MSEPRLNLPELEDFRRRLARARLLRKTGRIQSVVGALIKCKGPSAAVGEVCLLHSGEGKHMLAEVVGFEGPSTLLMPLGQASGLMPGQLVEALGEPLSVRVGPELLGKVVDALGEPLKGSLPKLHESRPLDADPPKALSRALITRPLPLGVRSLDGFVTCGRGQRLGIFAGSGVGKSVLMGMIARKATAEIIVVGLIGERGREVREFIERDLGDALKRSVVVVATSDESPLRRLRAAFCATAIAEYFRDQGKDVLLMLDSLTRVAMAQREIGLAAGEPPASKGYVPSMFSLLPRLLERAGVGAKGSITALYTVLVEGDDLKEPVADAARSILDGHLVLSRELAQRNHYPAVDVLQSVSRVMPEVVSATHLETAGELRKLLATYQDAEDLIRIGAYSPGADPEIDRAREVMPRLMQFLRQKPDEFTPYEETLEWLEQLVVG